MRKFIKVLLTGAFLGTMASLIAKPKRKPVFKKVLSRMDDMNIKKSSGKVVKGIARAVDRVWK